MLAVMPRHIVQEQQEPWVQLCFAVLLPCWQRLFCLYGQHHWADMICADLVFADQDHNYLARVVCTDHAWTVVLH